MLPDRELEVRAREAEFQKTYFFNGKYDRRIFLSGVPREFARDRRYDAGSNVDMCKLLGFIELDSGVADVRWAAYMLATAFVETGRRRSLTVASLDAAGKPVFTRKGKPVTHTISVWHIMAPVDETGRGSGKDYGAPVKVFQLANGNVRVTEQDGDQWIVKKNGYFDTLSDNPRQGATYGGSVNEGFDKDLGVPHVYYGRGYVQVTWWYGYAKAGIGLGMGLDLLLNPDKAKEPDIAYAIMSNRLVKGVDVKGGKTLASFINGDNCDYEGARALVNPYDGNGKDVAAIAVKFEKVLRESIVKS